MFIAGAAPPFGTLYGHRVFVEQCFVGEPEMVFNAGTHTESLCMHYGDFARNFWGVASHFYRLVLMYAIAFALWWIFRDPAVEAPASAGKRPSRKTRTKNIRIRPRIKVT